MYDKKKSNTIKLGCRNDDETQAYTAKTCTTDNNTIQYDFIRIEND